MIRWDENGNPIEYVARPEKIYEKVNAKLEYHIKFPQAVFIDMGTASYRQSLSSSVRQMLIGSGKGVLKFTSAMDGGTIWFDDVDTARATLAKLGQHPKFTTYNYSNRFSIFYNNVIVTMLYEEYPATKDFL